VCGQELFIKVMLITISNSTNSHGSIHPDAYAVCFISRKVNELFGLNINKFSHVWPRFWAPLSRLRIDRHGSRAGKTICREISKRSLSKWSRRINRHRTVGKCQEWISWDATSECQSYDGPRPQKGA
jgi:hypothetical protein